MLDLLGGERRVMDLRTVLECSDVDEVVLERLSSLNNRFFSNETVKNI